MKTSDIGTYQELQPNGMIATSWTRKAATWTFIFWVLTTVYFCASYEYHFYLLAKMVGTKPDAAISNQTFITITSQMEVINWTIFSFFALAVFAPKALQKVVEMKAGIKSDSSETSIDKTN